MNNLAKNIETSKQNRSKIDLESTNNRPKIDETQCPEGVWADSRLQARLGSVWPALKNEIMAKWPQIGSQN